jgi:hypothetical protein
MYAWAGSRPQRCVKIGVDAVAWAETQRNWRGRRRHRCAMSPLPDGVVRPSPAERNLSDLGTLEGRLRALAGPAPAWRLGGRELVKDIPRPIVLLVPDAAVRAVVLHLEQLPRRREEREALIRWRLGQEQLFPLAGARVVSQVYGGAQAGDGQGHTVLAVAVQESVLQQYETLCEAVGLIPQEVGLTSLQLFELWRRASGLTQWQRRDLLWVSLADRSLTTMVFQQGRLLFYRCKLLGSEAAEITADSRLLTKIVEECGASLDACQQRHPHALVKEAVVCAEGNLSALQAQIEAELELSVEPLGWRAVETLGWVTRGSQPGMASLSAVAGLC